jgi:hypothetical protein
MKYSTLFDPFNFYGDKNIREKNYNKNYILFILGVHVCQVILLDFE